MLSAFSAIRFRNVAIICASFALCLVIGGARSEARADVWDWLSDLVIDGGGDGAENAALSGMVLPDNAIVTAPGEIRTLEYGRDVIQLYPSTAVTVELAAGKVKTVHLITGTLRAVIAKRKKQPMTVDTRLLVGTVKGTVFEVSSAGTASALSVYEGRVAVKSKHGTGGIDVTPGKTATVDDSSSEAKLGATPEGGAAAAVKSQRHGSTPSPSDVPDNSGERVDRDAVNPSRPSSSGPPQGSGSGGNSGSDGADGEGGEHGDGEGGEHGESGEHGEGGGYH